MSNSSIWHINRTLSGVTTLDQSGPGSDGDERVLYILQSLLEPHHQIISSHSLGKVIPSVSLQRGKSQSILQHKPTGLFLFLI